MSTQRVDGMLAWVLPNGDFYYPFGDNVNCTAAVCPAELSIYGYRPSLATSGAMIALYAICMAIQLALGVKYRTWWFMACMVTGCIVELLGYVGRILYYQNPWGQGGFLMQIVLITIGPVFFSAAIYVLLSQIVAYISPKDSRIKPSLYIWIFITCDVLALILQAIGGGMSNDSDGPSQIAVDIALAGLSIQVITLFFFAVLVLDYFVRSRKTWRAAVLPTRFKVFCAALAAATVFILIRCCYRVYELSEGYSRTSEALRDEGLFTGLEAVMVVLAAYCLIVAHPGIGFKRDVAISTKV